MNTLGKNWAKTMSFTYFLPTYSTLGKNPPYTPHRGVYIGMFLPMLCATPNPLGKNTGVFAHLTRRATR